MTHFVAMIAFDPGVPVSYAMGLTTLSLAASVVLPLPAFLMLARAAGAWQSSLAALLVVGDIAVMHYIGMSAVHVSGTLAHRLDYVVASILTSFCFAVAACRAFSRGRVVLAGILLVPTICAVHFFDIAAITVSAALDNVGTFGVIQLGSPIPYLAFAVAAVGFLALILALLAALMDRRIAAHLAQDARRFRQFASATSEGILFLRGDVAVDANEMLCQILARDIEDVVGLPVDLLLGDAVRAWAMSGGQKPLETELQIEGGGRRPVELTRRDLCAGVGAETVLSVRDVTDRKAAECRIERLAHYDLLTGLSNRALFQDRLERSLALAARTGTGTALLCLDLDRFKAVNDDLGHGSGDFVLKEVAARLTRSVREMDEVARLAGNEFAIIQQMVEQPEDSAALAERLVQELSRPYYVDGQKVDIGASVGIAIFPNDAADGGELLRSAELALHRAKQESRGSFRYYEPEMDKFLQRRRVIERELRDACARGELELFYQPLCDTASMTIVGHEALLRWRHPKRGLVAPSDFISVAEESGLIIPMGRWVIDTACAAAAAWAQPLRVAVNVSPLQFRDPDLVATVAAALKRHALDPKRLELEITEGVLIQHTDEALAVLRQLKVLGVRIVLDDFGTGYSSLSYLQRFPFDKIKIDRSFVQNLGIEPAADTLVGSIIALGLSLQLEVTAEGVETDAQRVQLRAMHCSQLQGYLIGRPAPIASVEFKYGNVPAAASAA